MFSAHRCAQGRLVGLAVALLLGVAVLPPALTADVPHDLSRRSAAIIPIDAPLSGVVLTRQNGVERPVAGAHVGTGEISVETDAQGRFHIPARARTNQISVVAAGYRPLLQESRGTEVALHLEPLEVRGIYVPLDRLRQADTLAWVLDLARAGTITALVVDVKDEGGAVLSLLAPESAWAIGAAWNPGQDMASFFAELGELGIYRIARVVTFLDSRFAYAHPTEAIRTVDGEIFVGRQKAAWVSAFSPAAQRYNIEIGVAAAAWFEEVQYDYVRLPTEGALPVRENATGAERSAAIAGFARDAAEALHAVGAALAFDTFGQTTVIHHDDGIGQILEDVGPHLDYLSPMVYPSTWASGWFGYTHPAAEPYGVVHASVAESVARLAHVPGVVVRPWLQDFPDYQASRQPYGVDEVRAQIEASEAAGGSGFMLWDPSLDYQFEALAALPAVPSASATALHWEPSAAELADLLRLFAR